MRVGEQHQEDGSWEKGGPAKEEGGWGGGGGGGGRRMGRGRHRKGADSKNSPCVREESKKREKRAKSGAAGPTTVKNWAKRKIDDFRPRTGGGARELAGGKENLG